MRMWVDEEELNNCIAKARELAEQYRQYVMAGDGSYKSLDDAVWMCQEHLGKKIEIREFVVTSERSVEGIFLYNEDEETYYIIVYVHPDLNPDHCRFIQFKELFHVLLDAERFRNMDVDGHIDESQSCFSIEESKPTPRVVSEIITE